MYESKPITPHRQPCLSPTPPAPSEEEIEQEFYNLLTSDGGRPAFPIARRDEIRAAPEDHWELLQPWSTTNEPRAIPDCRRIFATQYDSWRDFRLWQEKKRDLQESESSGFAEYVVDVQARLSRHWFKWQGYKLCRDLEKQDALGTWIEYLNYGYLCFEMARDHAIRLRRSMPPWQKPQDDGMSHSEARRARSAAFQCERRAFWIRDQVPLVAAQLSITIPGGKRVRFDEHATIIGQAAEWSSEDRLVAAPRAQVTSTEPAMERALGPRKRRSIDQGDEDRPRKRRKLS